MDLRGAFAQNKTASLLSFSLAGCSHLARKALAKRRMVSWSGRRDSNPRHPTWKAGCHTIAASLLRTGLTGSCIPYTSNVSVPDKRCHVQIWCLRQKMSRNFEGRISQAQGALEQLYPNFYAKTREAGGQALSVIAKRAAISNFHMLFFHESRSR
jgi:hypothetical protein